MTRYITTTLVLMTFFVISLSAQTLDEILKKHYEARGGLTKMKAVKSMQINGKLMMMGKEFPIRTYKKRPASVRTEIVMGKRSIIEAYDGKTGWQMNPMMGSAKAVDKKGDELNSIKEDADIDGLLVDWKTKGLKLELIGKEDLKGKQVFHIKAVRADESEKQLFLDAETYLLVQQSEKIRARDTDVNLVSTFSDFRKINSLMIPFFQEDNGGMSQKTQIDTIIFNKPIPDSLFTKQ
jgi:hypothetical protein